MADTDRDDGTDQQHSERWLSTRDAAVYTGYATTTISLAASRGALRGHRLPGRVRGPWRYRKTDLDAWLGQGERKPRVDNVAPGRLIVTRRGAA